MKQALSILFMLMIASGSFCQHSDSTEINREQLYKKARHQNTTAIVMLAGGGAVMLTGFTIGTGRIFHEIGSSIDGHHDNTFMVGQAFFITGAVSMLASIPLFIIASKNRNHAKNLAVLLKNENATVLTHTSLTPITYSAISLKINF